MLSTQYNLTSVEQILKITRNCNLTHRLLKQDKKWIEKRPLLEVVLRIYALWFNDKKNINSDILVRLTKRLIIDEVEPGGPYHSPHSLETNIIIAQMFYSFGSRLDKLEKYLNMELQDNYSISFFAQSFSTWPNQMFPKVKVTRQPLSKLEYLINRLTSKSLAFMKNDENVRYGEARGFFNTLDDEFSRQGNNFIDLIIEKDKNEEIIMLNHLFAKSICFYNKSSDTEFINKLSISNLYAWIAYTIYDDITDENKNINLLPLANILHRKSYQQYIELCPYAQKTIDNAYFTVDKSLRADQRELINFNSHDKSIIIVEAIFNLDVNDIYSKSIGHILGPLLFLKKYNTDFEVYKKIKKCLQKYLISKQINDDLSDWQDDLNNGNVTYVLKYLFVKLGLKSGNYSVMELTKKIKEALWKSELINLANTSLNMIKEARYEYMKLNVILNNNDFDSKILSSIQKDCEIILEEHLESKKFLLNLNLKNAPTAPASQIPDVSNPVSE